MLNPIIDEEIVAKTLKMYQTKHAEEVVLISAKSKNKRKME